MHGVQAVSNTARQLKMCARVTQHSVQALVGEGAASINSMGQWLRYFVVSAAQCSRGWTASSVWVKPTLFVVSIYTADVWFTHN